MFSGLKSWTAGPAAILATQGGQYGLSSLALHEHIDTRVNAEEWEIGYPITRHASARRDRGISN